MPKVRLDLLLVERGLVESRSLAQRLVMAGQVRVNQQLAQKPGDMVDPAAMLEIDQGPAFVSRGGEKLAGAFETFDLDVNDLICADVGASTGGFTDCLLQNGASKVYAIDVGNGILHWKLRQDERVVVMEGTNARNVQVLPEPVSFVVVDASFISLKVLLPVILNWFPKEGGSLVALIKPQFEAGRKIVTKGRGVVRDQAVHQKVIEDILIFARSTGYRTLGLARSPITGPKGNVEFLAWLGWAQGLEVQSKGLVGPMFPDLPKPSV